ncbi:MAG: phosphate propanoyltransferase [Vallitalea sp.]|jgi:putative phosphotransacetylase|nr:phosphate propanoyltransferase [Vallitalea sp.]
MNQLELVDLISKKVLQEVRQPKGGIPVGVSARHLHLSKEDVEKLFGVGYELTPIKELMGGQYAAKETVTIVGTKLRPIENVRVLGPTRSKTQVEVAKTDAIRLGLNPPVKPSGELEGSAPITIVGPKGAITLENACIIAMRHIHMSPQDAIEYGVKDKEIVDVEVSSDRGGVFTNVLVRVHDTYTLEMHIDTDEANALSVKCNDSVKILKVYK